MLLAVHLVSSARSQRVDLIHAGTRRTQYDPVWREALQTMVHQQNNVYEAHSPIHGMGIFAGRDFHVGERVVLIDDARIVPEGSPDVDADGRRLYYDDISGGRVVQLGPLQYTNHSCDFTTYTKTIGGVRYRIARRDIHAADEITSHYCINANFGGTWACNCGSPTCLRQLTHSYFALPNQLQLEYLPFLDDWFIKENRQAVEELRRAISANLSH